MFYYIIMGLLVFSLYYVSELSNVATIKIMKGESNLIGKLNFYLFLKSHLLFLVLVFIVIGLGS